MIMIPVEIPKLFDGHMTYLLIKLTANTSDLSNPEYAIFKCRNCNTFQRAESINYISFYSWIKLEINSKI